MSWTEIIRTKEDVCPPFGNLLVDAVYDGRPSADMWVLHREETKGTAAEAMMAALQEATYRAQPAQPAQLYASVSMNLAISRGKIGDAMVCIGDGEGQTVLYIDVYGDGKVVLMFDGSYGECYIFQTDSAVYEALAAIIQEYGEFQEH